MNPKDLVTYILSEGPKCQCATIYHNCGISMFIFDGHLGIRSDHVSPNTPCICLTPFIMSNRSLLSLYTTLTRISESPI